VTALRALSGRIVPALIVGLLGILAVAGCGAGAGGDAGEAGTSAAPSPAQSTSAAPTVTFVELGSDKCIPCKEMRPVMDAIQAAFGDQVEIVFYDVWENKAPAEEYGIQYIPTQVFLDEDGDEFHRHTGFYPQEEIEAMLVEHGLERLATP
jgi:thioredoxin 1